MNVTTSDVTQGRKRKRGDAGNANKADDQAASRSSKRQLRSTVEKSSQEISTTRTRKRGRR